MSGGRVERRLAAVLTADAVGYSRLMGADEVGTLEALKAIRREVVDPAIAGHNGRIVKTTGDGMLVEFASAVDAVNCAMSVQEKMAERNRDFTPTISFRMGINIGDIIIDDNDIFGDGVNVAARIENECEPGRVYLSEDAFRQVRGKTLFEFDDLGERTLKNIDRPVRLYAAVAGDRGAGAEIPATATGNVRKSLPLPHKPSIAVLPFQNMSGDPEQDYFADGMVEDIITALSQFKSLFVIARNSSFTYKGKTIDIKQVGSDLGVRYVLEGSVRKSGSRVRITGQLIEAETNRHLWADKFDGALADVFDLQDQVTSSVVGLIAPKLEQAEIERVRQKPTENLDSYDFFLRGLSLTNKGAFADARSFFNKACEHDPEYGPAHAMAATTLMFEQGHTGKPLTAGQRAEAVRLANLASRVASDDAFTLARAGHVLTYLGREYDRGASMVEQAVALNPNLAIAWYSRGWVTMMCGEAERSIESFDRMIRLSPLDPLRVGAWNGSSFAFFSLGRYEEGCVSAEKSIQFVANFHTLGAYIVNAIPAGRASEARQAAARVLKSRPEIRATDAEDAFPTRSPELRSQIIAALREAGLPG